MQYSAGTCRVTKGSQTVYRNGTTSWAGIATGAMFGVQGEGVFYTVQQFVSPDHIILTAPYQGVTNASALYVIVNDFSTNLRLPLVNRGDLETATIFDYAMVKLESTFKGAPGDMFKAVYDVNANGIVDAAETVPWAGITGKPLTFPPSVHAIQHLDNGNDPLPVATFARTGAAQKLSGVPTQYFNGVGAWTDPTTQLSGDIMHKAVYDTDSNGVVDTCDSLDWGKLTNLPTTFFPSLHALTHLDNGSDVIPPATTSRTGLSPKLSGDATTFYNGVGGFSVPPGQPLVVRGTVPTAPSGLPPTGANGDVWVAEDTGHGWSWNGTTWVDIGPVSVGPAGPQGNPGVPGQAFTYTSQAFTVPPVGQSAILTVGDTSWMTPGQTLWVATAGGSGNAACLKLVSKSGNTITVLNPPPTVGVAGPPGPAGTPGAPGLVWKGNWAGGTNYNVGDAVFYYSDSFIATAANVNTPPPGGPWQTLVVGSVWWNGHGPPVTVTGATAGDYYLDVDSGLSYVFS